MKKLLGFLLLSLTLLPNIGQADEAKATFAGGCFWCMEPPFEKLEGVKSVVSGYTGGDEKNPTYEQVSGGRTGHIEAVEVTYDPKKISYEKLLKVYWRQINPTDTGGQFVDRGKQYSTAIFYHSDEQKGLAEKSKKELSEKKLFDAPLVTPIKKAGNFYPAEAYHQDYYKKNSLKYKFYRSRSGRDDFLEKIWSQESAKNKPSKEELRKRLTPLQFRVTQEDGTEPPFENPFHDHKEEGIYVDIVCNEPLFSSRDKFDSKTGWPSFTKPIDSKNITKKKDWSLLGKRIEVRSKKCDAHLGHVFEDGPMPTGLRYCINSAALRFIPKSKLKDEGLAEYLKLFN